MVDRIAQAVEESVNNIKHQKGISVNSPQFKEMVQKQLERFEATETKRQERRNKELQNLNSNTNTNRKRSNDDDESDGRGNKGVKKRQNADGFTKVLGRYPKNSRESRIPPNEHDFYDGLPSISDNRFNVLANDLRMSNSDDEDYIRNAKRFDVQQPSKFV